MPEVRVVGEGIEQGVFPTHKAVKIAEEMDLDLVEISPNAKPPVCKIIDYKKFLYEQKRKQKEMKSKQVKVVLKEIRFGPNTDEHDFQFKLKHAIKFLSEGAKLKAFVFFKGRSIIYKDRGEILLLKFLCGTTSFLSKSISKTSSFNKVLKYFFAFSYAKGLSFPKASRTISIGP